MKRIAIIGAGLAGLTCGKALQQAGHDVVIFEKSRGIGGRLATRRAEPFYFDHGVAAFTASDDDFQGFVNQLLAEGVVAVWAVDQATPDNSFVSTVSTKPHSVPRVSDCYSDYYVGIPAMNAIGKHLARGLTVQRNTRVASIIDHHPIFNSWELLTDKGETLGQFDWIISAMPVEQAKSFAQTSLHTKVLNKYALMPCSVLMLGFDTPLALDYEYAKIEGEDIDKIIVNSAKPHRKGGYSLVIHSTPAWTNRHIEEDKTACINHLTQAASQILGIDLSTAAHKDIHHWRYATGEAVNLPSGDHQLGYLLDSDQNIGVCGDWLLKGDVESAYLSGQKLAKAIIGLLKSE